MTTFLRYAHLSLVAYPALAIILLLAFAAEELKPCAEKQGREAPDRRREAERKKRHAGAREGHTCQRKRRRLQRRSGCRSPVPDGLTPEAQDP